MEWSSLLDMEQQSVTNQW